VTVKNQISRLLTTYHPGSAVDAKKNQASKKTGDHVMCPHVSH